MTLMDTRMADVIAEIQAGLTEEEFHIHRALIEVQRLKSLLEHLQRSNDNELDTRPSEPRFSG